MVLEAKGQNVPVQLETDLGGAEIVLQRMSDILVEDNGQQIAEAFKRFDTDGSGYLDGPEFCAALRQVRNVPGHGLALLLLLLLSHTILCISGPGHDHCG